MVLTPLFCKSSSLVLTIEKNLQMASKVSHICRILTSSNEFQLNVPFDANFQSTAVSGQSRLTAAKLGTLHKTPQGSVSEGSLFLTNLKQAGQFKPFNTLLTTITVVEIVQGSFILFFNIQTKIMNIIGFNISCRISLNHTTVQNPNT